MEHCWSFNVGKAVANMQSEKGKVISRHVRRDGAKRSSVIPVGIWAKLIQIGNRKECIIGNLTQARVTLFLELVPDSIPIVKRNAL